MAESPSKKQKLPEEPKLPFPDLQAELDRIRANRGFDAQTWVDGKG